jgi:polysaccharide biosynthesis/export protein
VSLPIPEFQGRILRALVLLVLLTTVTVASAQAQSEGSPLELYKVGVSDLLRLSVWQQPELDRTLTVDEDGLITVPLIGEVRAAGYSLSELEQEILNRIQVFHRDVPRVTLDMAEYNSKAIYVLGAVTQPGKFAVYPVPNVWQAIREAGGVAPDGDLSRVRIYRNIDGQQVVETINLEALIGTAGLLEVPVLHPGETVDVPRQPLVPGSYTGQGGVYVLGEVLRPGVFRIESGVRDMLGFILQAGGPTEHADMSKVLLLRTQPDGSLIRLEMNLSSFLEDADRKQNPLVEPGDTIFLSRGAQISSIIRSNLAIVTGFVTVLTSIILISSRN